MFNNYLAKAQELMMAGKPFVVAVVVNHQPPVSGKPGYRAIITGDGEIWGWIGGGCSQAIIQEEALVALKNDKPRFIRITPEPADAPEGVSERRMTCHSGGTLEIFMEPVNNPFQLIIFGSSAVAKMLSDLAKAMEIKVVAVGPNSDSLVSADRCFLDYDPVELAKVNTSGYMVVATQGEADELALETALKLNPEYCAFVASAAKSRAIWESLRARGISQQILDEIRSPAGLDIGATLPSEIALSILAEIIKTRRRDQVTEIEEPDIAIDPICGMSVKITADALHSGYQEHNFYFCGAGCKATFDAHPEEYVTSP